MTTITQNEKGFTLVELAIVLVIVGLLIGGILKGQELIANAQVTATMNQLTGFDAATSTFRDKYNSFPGDMANATNRLPNCAAPCAAGNGNGQLGQGPSAVPANEAVQYFLHLRADGLITGFTGDGNVLFGEQLPTASIGGGFFAGYANAGAIAAAPGANSRRGHYIAVAADPGTALTNAQAGNGAFTAAQGGRVDIKLDDGNPQTGAVVAGDGCVATIGGVVSYDSGNETVECPVFYRIQ
jgi:prepilin-type N-terminal cleavage/methylation domain-containing protein